MKKWVLLLEMGWVITGYERNYRACKTDYDKTVCINWSGSLKDLKDMVDDKDYEQPICIKQSGNSQIPWVKCEGKNK
jgi:hypothetical protein